MNELIDKIRQEVRATPEIEDVVNQNLRYLLELIEQLKKDKSKWRIK